jgi:hypothetical protein
MRASEEILAELQEDSSWQVRWRVAMHPHLPVARRTALLCDANPKVAQMASAASTLWASFGIHPSDDEYRMGLTWLDQVLGSDWEMAKAQLMKVSGEVRQAMKAILTAQILCWDEKNKIWPKEDFRNKEEINCEKTASLLSQADFPCQALSRFSQSRHWEVRYLVALHEGTPLEARRALSLDGNRYVRAAARLRTT